MPEFDICIIGSGAGGGPIAKTLAEGGKSVVVLEKGPHVVTSQFSKDEIALRRGQYRSHPQLEPQIIETIEDNKTWYAQQSHLKGWNLHNGSLVGGATNFMSGFFHRLKPDDFRLKSAFGPIKGANVEDWPISYDDLEPYYAKVEQEVGVSGRVTAHPFADKRSTPAFPFAPTYEHPVAAWIDKSCQQKGLHPFPVARAILSKPHEGRGSCSYSGYCGSYGCATNAKSSSRVALLNKAVKTEKCQIISDAFVYRIESDQTGKATAAHYFDGDRIKRRVSARIFVVACHAIESARLLLLSKSSKHPQGLGNQSGLVGQNLLFSSAGWGEGELRYADFSAEKVSELKSFSPFINRSLQDWYFYNNPQSKKKQKGGTIDFLFSHPNPIRAAMRASRGDGGPLWGSALKGSIHNYFIESRHLRFEVFADWLPNPNCNVTIDPKLRDQWGVPVARVRIFKHPKNWQVAKYLTQKGLEVFRWLGVKNVEHHDYGNPSTNLIAGTCRFGHDPRISVLNADCRAHNVENLYVTDGSFMPTGGSVPYTFTIYANAFRVADKILASM